MRFNPDEAEKHRLGCEATLEKVRKKLASGGVKASSRPRLQRFLQVTKCAAAIDPARVTAYA